MKNLNGKFILAASLLLVAGSVAAMEGSLNEQLLQAAFKGDVVAVRRLIGDGADVNTRNEVGNTPLYLAVNNVQNPAAARKTIQVLLKAGADINATNSKGSTPLHSALLLYQYETALLLMEEGANVKIADKAGWTPLHNAAFLTTKIDILRKLMDAGADINAKTKKGETPLDLAQNKATKMALIAYTSPEEVLRIVASVAPGQLSEEEIRSMKESAVQELINEKLAIAKQAFPRRSEDRLRQEITNSVMETLKRKGAL